MFLLRPAGGNGRVELYHGAMRPRQRHPYVRLTFRTPGAPPVHRALPAASAKNRAQHQTALVSVAFQAAQSQRCLVALFIQMFMRLPEMTSFL